MGKEDRVGVLHDFFQKHGNRSKNNWYAAKFFFCEFLNLVNVIGQIYFVDLFLGGEFTTYGSDVWGMMQEEFEERTDPMAMVFPKMAKCTFHKYGPTGTIQRHDGLCILPVNIINEKIYFFLWFWFVALAIITGVQQVYRLITVLVPGLQVARMKSLARAVPEHKIRDLSKWISTGDWFLHNNHNYHCCFHNNNYTACNYNNYNNNNTSYSNFIRFCQSRNNNECTSYNNNCSNNNYNFNNYNNHIHNNFNHNINHNNINNYINHNHFNNY